jgi:CBS domain-containing protein
LDAIDPTRSSRIGCLPVVEGERPAGVIVERDFVDIAPEPLAAKLRELREGELTTA